MQESKQNKIFEEPNIAKSVWSLALPTIIGMLIMALYNIIDTFFIGQTNDPLQVAAVSLSMPIFMMLMSLGNLFGVGASSCISRKLGEKEFDIIKNISSTALYTAILAGLLVIVLGLIFLENLAFMLGANELTIGFVKGYLAITLLGAPFILCSLALTHIIRSEGNAKTAMRGMLLSTIINIILDPIFIFVLNLGVVGAALATTVANIVSFIFYIVMIIKNKESYLDLHFRYFTLKSNILQNVLSIGFPASVTSLLTSISTIIYNLCLTPYGDEAVASMGIVMKITLMYMMVFMGMSAGVQALFGYCYGARNYKKLKAVFIYSIKSSIVIGLCFCITLYLASSIVIGVFIDDESILYFGTKMLRAQIFSAPTLGIIYLSMSLIQATGKSLSALVLSSLRQGVFFIPIIYILSNTADFTLLIWAQVISDSLALLVTLYVLYAFFKELNTNNISKV